MHIKCKTLWLQKDGNTAEEYEDAAFPSAAVDAEMSSFRCAIADGATESSFSGLWSSILVEGLVCGSDLKYLRNEFKTRVGTRSLPWYAEEKLQAGAFAAIATLSLKEDDDGGRSWQSEAIGDCCVMHVRKGQLLTSFPLDRPESFNNSPILLCSGDTSSEQEDALLNHTSNWQHGDSFWLMTDALASWSLRRLRDYEDAFELLEHVDDLDSFKEFVVAQRKLVDEDGRPYLKNDDLTLIRIFTTDAAKTADMVV